MYNQRLNSVLCRVSASFLRKENLVWASVKRNLWAAPGYALKDETRFSTKAQRNEEGSIWWRTTMNKDADTGMS